MKAASKGKGVQDPNKRGPCKPTGPTTPSSPAFKCKNGLPKKPAKQSPTAAASADKVKSVATPVKMAKVGWQWQGGGVRVMMPVRWFSFK